MLDIQLAGRGNGERLMRRLDREIARPVAEKIAALTDQRRGRIDAQIGAPAGLKSRATRQYIRLVMAQRYIIGVAV